MGDHNSNKGVRPEHQDDFKKIKKISPATDRALHALGIHTYEDLAALTPEYLFDLLQRNKAGAVSLVRIQREDWLGQARALVQAKAHQKPAEIESASVGEDAGESTAGRDAAGENATGETVRPANAAVPDGASVSTEASIQGDGQAGTANGHSPLPAGSDWLEMADFFVSFGESISEGGKTQVKTRVVHSQLDSHMEWDGIAMDALVQWMSEQGHLPKTSTSSDALANEAAATKEPAASQPAEPAAARTSTHPDESHENVRLSVSNVWVSQVPQAELPPEHARQRWVRVEASIDLVVDDPVIVLEWPASFSLNILLVNIATNDTLFIEPPVMPLVPDEMPYAFQHDFPVPPPGRYQLYLLVRLPTAEQVMALHEGPIVRVEG